MARVVVSESSDTAPWLVDWLGVTLFVSIAISLVDAALIQRKLSYFTGGFLSEDHISGVAEAATFVAASLLSDAAVAGTIVAIVLWLCGCARIARRFAVPAAFVAALTPPVVANVIVYKLREYLGDAFDFALMFDLSGRNPGEILAVSSAHLLWFGGLAVAAVAAAVVAIVILRRRGRTVRSRVEQVRLRRALMPAAILLLVGLVGTTLLRVSSVVVEAGMRWKPTGQWLGTIVQKASDFDSDGAGLLSRPGDPAPRDARIRPYAPEIPGDGVDEDGVGGDLPAATPSYVEPSLLSGRWRSKPDVVLVVLESVRADVIGQTWNEMPVTPTLNALAARGISAARAYSHNGFTVQSRRHMFSGSVADIRGARTLLDDFKDQGYETAYFSAQDESFGGTEYDIGFARADRAYDARQDLNLRFSTFATPGSLAVPYQVVVDRISAFLKSRSVEKPLFLVVNFQDTHFPYHHSRIRPVLNDTVLGQFDIAPAKASDLHAMFLNTVRNVDDAIGTVLEQVQAVDGREPGVIVLSDHGESLYDEGFLGHGYALNDAQTRIPLIVANLPLTIEEPFGQSDLRDAVAAAMSTPPTEGRHPRLVQSPSKRVFQYLGSVDRPAQIALTSADRQVAYDFRTGEARVNGKVWRRPEALSPEESREWLDLVQLWERMVIARKK